MKLSTMAPSVVALWTAFAVSAYAFPLSGVPVTTNPGPLIGNGNNSTVIFALASSDDDDLLTLGGNSIFDNRTDLAGDTKDLGPLVGPQVFGLTDASDLTTFLANVADSDGNYHVFYTTNYSLFGVGSLDPTVAGEIAALPPGTAVTFVGWEDLTAGQGSDFDYTPFTR